MAEKKGYFYETQEDAFVRYLKSNDKNEKDLIFNQYLYPAFVKMIESIIRKYNLYVPDEDFKDTFEDTISFLMTKVEHFDESIGCKAYSYCGTICKNYLIYKINFFAKQQKRFLQLDNIQTDEFNDNEYTMIIDNRNELSEKIDNLTVLIEETINGVKKMLNESEKNKLTENEIKTGKALCLLLENWEDLFFQNGSNKFNKSSILFYLRETTLLSTIELRKSMKKFKKFYLNLKSNYSN